MYFTLYLIVGCLIIIYTLSSASLKVPTDGVVNKLSISLGLCVVLLLWPLVLIFSLKKKFN